MGLLGNFQGAQASLDWQDLLDALTLSTHVEQRRSEETESLLRNRDGKRHSRIALISRLGA
jgi:hypothetical protein